MRQLVGRHHGEIALAEQRGVVDQQVRRAAEMRSHGRQQPLCRSGFKEIRRKAVPGRARLGQALAQEAVRFRHLTAVDGQRIAGAGQMHGNAGAEAAMTARDQR